MEKAWYRRPRTALFAFGLLALSLAGALAFRSFEAFEASLTKYHTIEIGMDMQEVRYLLGNPDAVMGPSERLEGISGIARRVYYLNTEDEQNRIPDEAVISDFDGWSWDFPSYRLSVDFTEETRLVENIGCYAPPENLGVAPVPECQGVLGISLGATEDEVVGLLGEPDHSVFEGPSKTLSYGSIGLEIGLTEQQVYSIRKVAPESAGLRWWLGSLLL